MTYKEKQEATKVELVILESAQTINKHLIQEGIEEWDKCGGGYFAQFIKGYVIQQWFEIARRN